MVMLDVRTILTPSNQNSGRGPLKTTMDVINAAKKISNSGSNLDDICMKIGEQV